MKFIKILDWIPTERKLLMFVRIGNKKSVSCISAEVSRKYHNCLKCHFNKRGCRRMCAELERMKEFKEIMKEIDQPRITPLIVQKMKRRKILI